MARQGMLVTRDSIFISWFQSRIALQHARRIRNAAKHDGKAYLSLELPNNPKLTSPSYLAQAQSTSSLLRSRYGAIPHSSSKQIHNQYPPCAINIFPVKSISSLRSERETVLRWHNDSIHVRKPQTEFPIPTINSKSLTKFRKPNTKCHNLQELMYRFQYQKHPVA